MRVIIFLLALVVLLALAGWITFSNDAGRSSVNLETQEIREDTGQALEKGSELLQEAEEEVAPDAAHQQPETVPPPSP